MTRFQPSTAQVTALALLAEFFRYRGWCQSPARRSLRKKLGPKYKRGWEIRLAAASQAELRQLRRLLRLAGFTVGRPFRKVNRIVQPLYGREQVTRLLEVVGPIPKRPRPRRAHRRAD